MILALVLACYTTASAPPAPATPSVGNPDCSNLDSRCKAECDSLGFWDCAGYHVACLAGDHTACCFMVLCDGDCETDCKSNCVCSGTPPGPPNDGPGGAESPGTARPDFSNITFLPESYVGLPPLARETNNEAYCEAQCPDLSWASCLGWEAACGQDPTSENCCWAESCDAKLFKGESGCVETCLTCAVPPTTASPAVP